NKNSCNSSLILGGGGPYFAGERPEPLRPRTSVDKRIPLRHDRPSSCYRLPWGSAGRTAVCVRRACMATSSIAVGDLPVEPVLQPLCVLLIPPLEVPPEVLQGEAARGLGDVAVVSRDRRESMPPLPDQGDDVGRQDVRCTPSASLILN